MKKRTPAEQDRDAVARLKKARKKAVRGHQPICPSYLFCKTQKEQRTVNAKLFNLLEWRKEQKAIAKKAGKKVPKNFVYYRKYRPKTGFGGGAKPDRTKVNADYGWLSIHCSLGGYRFASIEDLKAGLKDIIDHLRECTFYNFEIEVYGYCGFFFPAFNGDMRTEGGEYDWKLFEGKELTYRKVLQWVNVNFKHVIATVSGRNKIRGERVLTLKK